MAKSNVTILTDLLERKFFPTVRRPSRYIGGEINQTKKNLDDCDIKVALCFPDTYEIGMSHTGLSIIYHILNNIKGVAAERVFAIWPDTEELMREKKVPLFTLESKAAVADFDIVAFSLTNELCYTNMLNMLDLAGIPIRSDHRDDTHPLVIAGGQSPNYAEPIAPFVDIFVLGDGEQAVVQLIEHIRTQRSAGADNKQLLETAAKNLGFAYVPALYSFQYDGDKIRSFTAVSPDLPAKFENAVVDDFDAAPVPPAPIVPFAEAVHERVSVEIMRGCPGRCRFCQASFCKRPLRFRTVDRIVELAKRQYLATGFDTVSLLSLSSADYPDLEELVEKLQAFFESKHVGISLPSLKVKAQLAILPKIVSNVRKSGLTIAVEAASEKLRKIINKPITDADLFAGLQAAYTAGFQKIKLYFMVGFPGETEEDIVRIVDLAHEIARLRRKVDNKTASVNITVSWLVPKPHTPFAWLKQKPKDYFQNAKKLILDRKRHLNARFLQFKFHDIDSSILESAIARADRRIADVIETAWRSGARFDLWSECFDYDTWSRAFAQHGYDLGAQAQKEFKAGDILPWDHLGGSDKKHLLRHYDDAMQLAKE